MSVAESQGAERTAGPPGPIRVLLVEDDLDHAKLVEHALPREAGFDLYHVRTGSQALQAVRHHTFEAALVDYRLPDQEGIQLCTQLRERFEGALLLITSVARETAVQRAFEAGVDDYLVKDAALIDRLAVEVRRHLRARSR